MKIESAQLVIDPSTFAPTIRATVMIPLSPAVDGLYDEYAAMRVGRDFIRELNEFSEAGNLKTA